MGKLKFNVISHKCEMVVFIGDLIKQSMYILLTDMFNRMVKLFDCRSPGTHKTWQYEGEIERIMWNKFDPLYFFVS